MTATPSESPEADAPAFVRLHHLVSVPTELLGDGEPDEISYLHQSLLPLVKRGVVGTDTAIAVCIEDALTATTAGDGYEARRHLADAIRFARMATLANVAD